MKYNKIISFLSSFVFLASVFGLSAFNSSFKEVKGDTRTTFSYSGVNSSWNNTDCSFAPGYNNVLIGYGTYGVDYFSKSHNPDGTNLATDQFEIGSKLTINGIAIKEIAKMFPSTSVSYMHGNNYLYVIYPKECLTNSDTYKVPTLHIDNGTAFMDEAVGLTNLYLAGGLWRDTTTLSPREEISYLTLSDGSMLPPKYTFNGTNVCAIAGYSNYQFGYRLNFNLGTGDGNALLLDGIYGHLIIIQKSNVIIQPAGGGSNEAIAAIYIRNNEEHTLSIECYLSNTALTMYIAIDNGYVLGTNLTATFQEYNVIMMYGTPNQVSVRDYENIFAQTPKIVYSGQEEYDVNEGETSIDFASLVDAYDITNPNIKKSSIKIEIPEGMIKDGKYVWGRYFVKYVIEQTGFNSDIVKLVLFRVHKPNEICHITFNGENGIDVKYGTKLNKPVTPQPPLDTSKAYLFDGWYFNNYKWNFSTDTVKEDMNLVSSYVVVGDHFTFNISYEGISVPSSSYQVAKGVSVSTTQFALKGYKVFFIVGGQEVSSVIADGDKAITVKYALNYINHAPKAASCTEAGNVEYWTNELTPTIYYGDKDGNTTLTDVVIPALGHQYKHFDLVDSTTEKEGVKEHYECERCGKYFVSEQGKYLEVSKESLVIAKKQASKGGCGGSLAALPLITISSLILVAFTFKKKEER